MTVYGSGRIWATFLSYYPGFVARAALESASNWETLRDNYNKYKQCVAPGRDSHSAAAVSL